MPLMFAFFGLNFPSVWSYADRLDVFQVAQQMIMLGPSARPGRDRNQGAETAPHRTAKESRDSVGGEAEDASAAARAQRAAQKVSGRQGGVAHRPACEADEASARRQIGEAGGGGEKR
jgi:hypothetical protein